jgi:hypothetical protein
MQIFLPFSDFRKSFQVLDNKRLGKQRVETYQIISAITRRPKLDGTPYKGWLNHPCTIMWKDHVPALKMYLNYSIEEWISRGFKNTMELEKYDVDQIVIPPFIGNEKFHSSHRANLLKKEPDFYNQYGWTENPEDPYVWTDKEGKWYEQHSGKKGRVYYEALAV